MTGTIGRENQVSMVVAYLAHGLDVDLVGRVGSGRTVLLTQLAEALREAGWQCLVLRPPDLADAQHVNALSEALRTARKSGGDPTRPRADLMAVESMVAARQTVILIDDWYRLDVDSWAALSSVSAHSRVQFVAVHDLLHHGTRPNARLPLSPGDAPVTVRIPHFTIDETRALAHKLLGAAMEPRTVTRFYAKSGGMPGILTTMMIAARVEGLITLRDGAWVATTDLWSPSFEGIVRRQLTSLTVEENSALALISTSRTVHRQGALELVPGHVLDALESREFVRVEARTSREWLTVHPPLIAEYFRHVDPRGRRDMTVLATEPGEHDRSAAMLQLDPVDPVFLRLIGERVQERVQDARSAWEESPSAETALRYLEAMRVDEGAAPTVDSVLSDSRAHSGSEHAVAEVRSWQASWVASVQGDVPAGLALLDTGATRHGAYERLADAARALLLVDLGRVDEVDMGTLGDHDVLPVRVRARLAIARGAVLAARGLFPAAHAALRFARNIDRTQQGTDVAALIALVHLGEGDFDAAVEEAVGEFQRAKEELDVPALWASGYVVGVLLNIRGYVNPLQHLADTFQGIGHAPAFPHSPRCGLLCALAPLPTIPGWSPRERNDADSPEGAYPLMSVRWARAEIIAREDPGAAAELLWEIADSAYRRGAIYAACVAGQRALQLTPDIARGEKVSEWVADTDSVSLSTEQDLIDALASKDATALIDAAEAIVPTGRVTHALHALTIAAQLVDESAGGPESARIAALRAWLEARFQPGSFDREESTGLFRRLTEREREVSANVAEGLTNQQIAERLHLSVRTVENHIHRSMRKVGATSRQQLARLFD